MTRAALLSILLLSGCSTVPHKPQSPHVAPDWSAVGRTIGHSIAFLAGVWSGNLASSSLVTATAVATSPAGPFTASVQVFPLTYWHGSTPASQVSK